MLKKLVAALGMLVIPMLAVAQTGQDAVVSGTVTDTESGDPLLGANVYVPELNLGAVTDADGIYRFTVPANLVNGQVVDLVAQYIGYREATSTITLIGGSITQDFAMARDVIGLEEVVVTGLGVTREKKAIGYAVQDVSAEDISLVRESNFLNALAGRVAGIQVTASSGAVGASTRIVLRGNSSLTGDNQPLFVVDGIPIDNTTLGTSTYGGFADMGNAAADINTSDIESVTVLKGPNAAAIYGNRAANGVILITTKTAQGSVAGAGTGVGKGISYESHFTTSNVTTLPDFQNVYGQGSPIGSNPSPVGVQIMADPEYGGATSAVGDFWYLDGDYGGTNDGTDESWGPPLDAGYLVPQWDSPLDANGDRIPTPFVSHPNNVADFFVPGTGITHNIAFSGTGGNTTYRLSLTNADETGIFPNTDQNRTNINFNGSIQITPKLSGQSSIHYIRTNNDNMVGNGYSGNNPLQQMTSWFGRQVDINKLKTYQNADGTPIRWNTSYHDNPYWIMNKNTNSRLRDRIIGNMSLNYSISKALSLTGRFGTDWYNEDRKLIKAMLTNDYPDGWFRDLDYYRNETNADLMLNVNTNLGDLLSVNAIIGGNYRTWDYRRQTTTVTSLIVPDLYAVSNASGVPQTGLAESHLVENSVYGTASIGFNNFLFIEATARNDWSSTLPQDNWSYFYPSLTGAVLFSELLGLDPSFLYGKVRASWARTGSSANPYQIQGVYGAGNPWAGTANLSYTNSMPNLNLKPEITTSTEFGTELRLFNNRIGLDLAYYKGNTVNQILALATSRSSGYSSQLINAGEISNTGLELNLTAEPIRSDNFSWELGLNYAKNDNIVEELYEDMERLTLYYAGWSVYVVAEPGQPFGQLFGTGLRRSPAGDPIITASGKYATEPGQIIGNVVPDWVGGMSNTIRFGPFTATALIDARVGGDIWSITNMFGMYAGILKETVYADERYGKAVVVSASGDTTYAYGEDIRKHGIVLDGVQEVINGTDTSYVKNTVVRNAAYFGWGHYGAKELNVFDGSYIKLRNLSIGIDLPRNFVRSLGLTRATLSVEGKNLLLLYKNIPHIDPETSYSATRYQGIEMNALPQAREFGINLRITL